MRFNPDAKVTFATALCIDVFGSLDENLVSGEGEDGLFRRLASVTTTTLCALEAPLPG